jgi:uncharacterized protein YjbI with pentapeptide repeats
MNPGDQYAAVLIGESGPHGPNGNLVIGYTVAVQVLDRESTVMEPVRLEYEKTQHLKNATIAEAERLLQDRGWRVSGDWVCLVKVQHWFAGDHGSWAAPVLPVTADMRLGGADLASANLAGRDLTATMMSGADLRGTNLTGADLTRADLSGADLTGATLTGALLHTTKLNGANLTRADLRGLDLGQVKLEGATLVEADLSAVTITGGNAVLTGANLTRAKLTGARLTFAKDTDFTGADLTDADLGKAWFSNTCLRGAKLTGANLYQATLYGVDLTGATLPDLDTMINVRWNDKTTWDPSAKAEMVRRSSEPKPLMVSDYKAAAPPSRSLIGRRKKGPAVEVAKTVRWFESILNPLPEKDFEWAVIKFLWHLPARRREAGMSGDDLGWATPAEITAGVGEELGRPVPEITVRSVLSLNSSPWEQPGYTAFHQRQDGRYHVYAGADFGGQKVSTLMRQEGGTRLAPVKPP